MNKADLIMQVCVRTGMTKEAATIATSAVPDGMREAMDAGEKVQLLNFGTFEARERAERLGRNPVTGELIVIPASKVIFFKTGKSMPYRYVLTDRMVRASELLCDAALGQAEEPDLYRMEMAGAMPEEMFFTSYVEGAQMTMEDAMAYLQSGTEPGNIYEHMLSNNRQAWATMMQGLYHPLDEGFVRMLAGMLTEDMEDNGADSDSTTIMRSPR